MKRVLAEMIGWGIFRIDGKLYVWDDYDDNEEHEGYGLLVREDDRMEIMGIERDENERPVAFLCA